MTVRADGTVRVLTGTASAGQQHERAYATLVAEVLPVSVDDVEVIEGDTELVEGSAGTSGSRSLQLAGSAVRGAALDVLEQARRLAADLLEAAVDDIVVDDDQFIVRGVPARGFTLAELAARADEQPTTARCSTPAACSTRTTRPTRAARTCRSSRSSSTPGGSRRCATSRSPTAARVVDPPSAAGQVVGASAQGIGQALLEEFVHDDAGNPLTSSLAEYLVPARQRAPLRSTPAS